MSISAEDAATIVGRSSTVWSNLINEPPMSLSRQGRAFEQLAHGADPDERHTVLVLAVCERLSPTCFWWKVSACSQSVNEMPVDM
jgi:hypothetical protein